MAEHVVVLGAGIIGLQIASTLLDSGYRVTCITKDEPGDEAPHYTSPWAGAHWRTHALAEDEEQCRWDIQTYNAWMQTIEDEARHETSPQDKCGLNVRSSRLFWMSLDSSSAEELTSSLWFSQYVQDFKRIPDQDLPPGVAYGVSFSSIQINVPKFLGYLMRRVKRLGMNVIKCSSVPLKKNSAEVDLNALDDMLKNRIQTSEDATSGGITGIFESCNTISAYVNATGLDAGVLFGDDKVYPVRGQTVLVDRETDVISTLFDYDEKNARSTITYAIPRVGSGTTVLGGCNQVDNWSCEVDPKLTQDILVRARELCKEILVDKGDEYPEFDVISAQVGLRPARHGGARVERELVRDGDVGRVIIHAYGHGGAGYQNSVGVAYKVLKLLKENHSSISASH